MSAQSYRNRAQSSKASDRDCVSVYERLKQQGVRPSIGIVLGALKLCRSSKDIETGRRIHADVVESGDFANIFVRNILEDMYARCGRMEEARQVFESMRHHDLVSWNSLILGYARTGDHADIALQLLARMQEEGFAPNHVTLLAALKACGSLPAGEEALQKVRGIHRQAEKMMLISAGNSKEMELFVSSSLVDLYAKCGSVAEARQVFDRMKIHDVVSWTAIILGYAQAGEPEMALDFYARMLESGRFSPDRITILAALKACAVLAEREQAKVLEGGKFIKVECLRKAKAFQVEARRSRVEGDLIVGTALVDLFAKCGSMVEARKIFEGLRERDVVSWTVLIAGYAQVGEAEEALILFRRMKSDKLRPDSVTFVAALKACGSLAALESGRRVEEEIREAGLESELVVGNSLVDFFGKCGCMEDAKRVFDGIQNKDLISWSSLMNGYCCKGDSAKVFQLFEEMKKMKEEDQMLKPDPVVYLLVLMACSHGGLVDRGKEVLEEMLANGVEAGIQHYTAVVDMLGRKNKLEEAVDVVRAMPFKANEVTWTTLLSSAKKWKNVGVGKIAFEELLKLGGGSAAYILMWGLYASVGMWEEAQRIDQMMIKSDCRRRSYDSWSSWTDEGGIVHKFVNCKVN